MKRSRLLLSFALALAAACGGKSADPRAQWVVRVHTDARVPQLGDRVLIQALDEDSSVACASCQRLFAVDGESWPVSFGLVASDGFSPRVRLRLFRAESLGGAGEPEGDLLIDRVVVLPPTDEKLVVDVVLSMNCFGLPASIDSGQSCDPATGELAADRVAGPIADVPSVGSWAPGVDRDCSGSAPDGMACVPGGVFLLGALNGISAEPALRTTPERLVRLDAFFLGKDEMTVGEARQILSENPDLPLPVMFDPNQPLSDHCTFVGLTNDENDLLPLNCVPRVVASGLCERSGNRLPTEAEWEYAAGNRGNESRYAWGEDGDVCAHAIVARSFFLYRQCLSDTIGPGLVANGSDTDVTEQGIRNLGGSLSEWVEDQVAAFNAPCWHPETRLLENPICTSAQAGPFTIGYRGGYWAGALFLARSTSRLGTAVDGTSNGVGMRCAHSATL